MREGSNGHARVDQEVDGDVPDPAGRTGDDTGGTGVGVMRTLDVVRGRRTRVIMFDAGSGSAQAKFWEHLGNEPDQPRA